MYSDEWNPEVSQNFNLTYVGQSWVAKRGHKTAEEANKRLDFANSTSFAFHDIMEMIQKSRRNASVKRALSLGKITLEDCQQIRKEMNMAPLSERYSRHLKTTFPLKPALGKELITENELNTGMGNTIMELTKPTMDTVERVQNLSVPQVEATNLTPEVEQTGMEPLAVSSSDKFYHAVKMIQAQKAPLSGDRSNNSVLRSLCQDRRNSASYGYYALDQHREFYMNDQ
jgi:hypothetical protein